MSVRDRSVPRSIRDKTKADRKAKAKSDRVQKKHIGIRHPSRLRGAGFQKAAPQRSASRPIIRKSERTDA